MTSLSGQTLKAGHFLQPTAMAMGQRIMWSLQEVVIAVCHCAQQITS
jgi:hypothetical protein